MNVTRALALPAIAMMAAALLAGCGNTKAESSSDPTMSNDAKMSEEAKMSEGAMMSEEAKG